MGGRLLSKLTPQDSLLELDSTGQGQDLVKKKAKRDVNKVWSKIESMPFQNKDVKI